MATPSSNYATLRNSINMPLIGLGTFKAFGPDVKSAVKAALDTGIRHIDTAAIYKNEHLVADALAEGHVPRDQVFLTTKISPYQQGRAKAHQACLEALQRLQSDYVDLMLIHWPGASKTDAASPCNAALRWETWTVLEEFYRQGKFRAIGVSNYEPHHVTELMTKASVAPMVNQFELHPRRPCNELRAVCAEAGIQVVAYASLGCGDLLGRPEVQQVAQAVGKSPAQVLLRWGLQQGAAVIPKSVRPDRIAEWSDEALLSWQLGPADMTVLDSLADGHKYCWDPSGIA